MAKLEMPRVCFDSLSLSCSVLAELFAVGLMLGFELSLETKEKTIKSMMMIVAEMPRTFCLVLYCGVSP